MLGGVGFLVYFDLTFSVQPSNLMGMSGNHDGKFLLQNPVTELQLPSVVVRKRIWEWSSFQICSVNQELHFSAKM